MKTKIDISKEIAFFDVEELGICAKPKGGSYGRKTDSELMDLLELDLKNDPRDTANWDLKSSFWRLSPGDRRARQR